MPKEKSQYERQWERVRSNRESLKKREGYPCLESIEETWEAIVNAQHVDDRDQLERTAESPLAAFSYYVDLGFYPPPELMLALNDAWFEYVCAGGKKTLEECFLIRPKKKVGNTASQTRTRMKALHLTFGMAELIKKGATQVEAAEEVAPRLGMDVETAAREYRRHINPRINPRTKKKDA